MTEVSISQIREEIKNAERNKSKSCWYNPTTVPERGDNGVIVQPQTIYFGEVKEGTIGAVPTWEDPVMDAGLFKANMNALKSGKINDKYAVLEDPFIGYWRTVSREYSDLVSESLKSGSMSNLKSAGVGLTGDFSAIDIVNVQQEMVNTELRPFSLELAVTTVSTPSLQLEVDSWTRFTGQKGIGEAVPPLLQLGTVSRTSFDLPKDGAAIGLSFEAQTRAVHDLYRTHVDNAISDLKRIKSNKIAVELETATDVSGADWATDTNNPYDNIGTVSDTIYANNGTVNAIATHDRPWRDFVSNDNYKGTGEREAHEGPFSTARVVGNVRGLEGITWYIDNEKTNTIATVYDKSAVYKMQGPVRTAVVRDEMQDVDMFRIFDFNLPKIIISGRIRDLTGVSA